MASRIAEHDVSLVGALAGDEPEQGEDIIGPSESGKADARTLLANCGVSNVTGNLDGQPEYLLEGSVDSS